ncbi:hypothetical protein HMPREF9946_03671 [Acetobacteraceae bacterium AT-5844]|nr:hypothetical protein HMPREF9946_03671 [Acetobacteraceae bacterium AT-5844]
MYQRLPRAQGNGMTGESRPAGETPAPPLLFFQGRQRGADPALGQEQGG